MAGPLSDLPWLTRSLTTITSTTQKRWRGSTTSLGKLVTTRSKRTGHKTKNSRSSSSNALPSSLHTLKTLLNCWTGRSKSWPVAQSCSLSTSSAISLPMGTLTSSLLISLWTRLTMTTRAATEQTCTSRSHPGRTTWQSAMSATFWSRRKMWSNRTKIQSWQCC